MPFEAIPRIGDGAPAPISLFLPSVPGAG
jgi:hypothetical protein